MLYKSVLRIYNLVCVIQGRQYLSMAGKVIINSERCKGCGLCLAACKQECLVISAELNSVGIFPAQSVGGNCTGCAHCALVCPDVAIEVCRDYSRIIEIPPKAKVPLTREKV